MLNKRFVFIRVKTVCTNNRCTEEVLKYQYMELSNASQMKTLRVCKNETLPCAAVGTASHQHGLEACTVYGRSGTVLSNDKAVPKLSTLNVHLSQLQTSNLGINTK